MTNFKITIISGNGRRYVSVIPAYSEKQALYKYIKAVPGDRWAYGLYEKGDSRVKIEREDGKRYEQTSLF